MHLETACPAASVLMQGMLTVERELCHQWYCVSVTIGGRKLHPFIRLSILPSIHPAIHPFIRSPIGSFAHSSNAVSQGQVC